MQTAMPAAMQTVALLETCTAVATQESNAALNHLVGDLVEEPLGLVGCRVVGAGRGDPCLGCGHLLSAPQTALHHVLCLHSQDELKHKLVHVPFHPGMIAKATFEAAMPAV